MNRNSFVLKSNIEKCFNEIESFEYKLKIRNNGILLSYIILLLSNSNFSSNLGFLVVLGILSIISSVLRTSVFAIIPIMLIGASLCTEISVDFPSFLVDSFNFSILSSERIGKILFLAIWFNVGLFAIEMIKMDSYLNQVELR